MLPDFGTNTTAWVLFLGVAILLCFFVLFVAFWVGWRLSQRSQGLSPYTGLPLRKATDLSYYSIDKYARYMRSFHQYDNQIFDLRRAALCRETGRLFPNAVGWFDIIRVDWNFLQKRYPGNYVSWGSLNVEQKEAVREAHDNNLEGFQTEVSCPNPVPRMIDSKYAYTKPGPLYVDLQTKVLLGWKEIPETELEVLIVQKPIKMVR